MAIIDRVIVDVLEEPSSEEYLLLQGLPGVGLVGLTVAEFLKDQFETRKIANIIPYDARPVAVVEGESYLASMIDELELIEILGLGRPVIVFTGKRQPEGSLYDTLRAILDVLGEKISDLVAVGGMTGSDNEIGAFAYDENTAKRLSERGVPPLRVKGHMRISGAVAAFPRLAAMRGIRARGLLAKVQEPPVDLPQFASMRDPSASKRAMKLLDAIYGLEIPEEKYGYFDEKLEDARRTLEEILKKREMSVWPHAADKPVESIHEGEEDKYYVRNAFMAGIKRRVFSLLKELGKATVAELAERLGEPYARVQSAVLALERDGLVRVTRRRVTYLRITPEGESALREGFPEYRLRDGEPIEEARARLGERLPIAIQRMLKKGFGAIEDGIIRIRSRPEISEDPQYKLLKRVASERVILEELGDQRTAKELLRRKMVRKEERSILRVELTDKGRETSPEDVFEEAYITQITPEMIARRDPELERRLMPYDPGVPVSPPRPGRKHLITILMERIRAILAGMGFKEIVPETPVISAFRNFDALFVPQNHPARQIHDTFYLSEPRTIEDFPSSLAASVRQAHTGDLIKEYSGRGSRTKQEAVRALLRTHTTAVTIKRLAENPKKPQRVFVIGRCYRNEKIDATHLAEFFQIDGIVYEDGMTLRHLLGILRDFYKALGFEAISFRPSYFPFTSPSVEVIAKRNDKRIELGGAGIFRPEVVRPLGIEDPVLAFGLGFERLAMLRAGIPDIRDVYAADVEKIARSPIPREILLLRFFLPRGTRSRKAPRRSRSGARASGYILCRPRNCRSR